MVQRVWALCLCGFLDSPSLGPFRAAGCGCSQEWAVHGGPIPTPMASQPLHGHREILGQGIRTQGQSLTGGLCPFLGAPERYLPDQPELLGLGKVWERLSLWPSLVPCGGKPQPAGQTLALGLAMWDPSLSLAVTTWASEAAWPTAHSPDVPRALCLRKNQDSLTGSQGRLGALLTRAGEGR